MFQKQSNRAVTPITNQSSPEVPTNLPRLNWEQMDGSEHFVQFYETDLFLLNSLSKYVASGLSQGEACILAATHDHINEVNTRLRAYGLDVDAARASGQYVCLDADQILPKFMVDGSPDASRFSDTVWSKIEQAIARGGRVRVFGELVGLLWAEGKHTAAIELEQLWNKMHAAHSFSLFCAYPMSAFGGESLAGPMEDVCSTHSLVIPAESYSELAETQERLRAVLKLQQKASSLDIEIAARKGIEHQAKVSEFLYRRHCDAVGDGLLILDPDTQKITDFNTPAVELLGVEGDLTGKELWEIGLCKDPKASREAFRELNDTSVLRYDDLQVNAPDGGQRFLELTGSLYSVDSERIAQFQVRDITKRKNAELAAFHLAAIVESSNDAIISKSLDGIILSWNRGAERIFGYKPAEIIGRSVLVLIPPERRDEEPVILSKLKHGERLDHFETIRVAKNGRRIDISLTISPIVDATGKIIAVSKIAREITEQKRIEREREQLLAREQAARADAETANRMKDEFLATVSHELRTPLNAIIGWSHLLTNGRIDGSTGARAIATIERNARAQAQLIEDILDVSRVISGKLRLKLGPVDLIAVINGAIDSVQLAADSKGIRVELTLDPSVRRISGDSARLQQVVWNLLSNAIKFTPQGGRIEVGLEHIDSYAQISVRDNGPGIDPDFLPYIFDRFRQADGTSTRRHGGLGLGLAIVRHLVELHGGTVNADSSPGGGAHFTIRLPFVPTDECTPDLAQNRVASSFRTARSPSDSIPSLKGLRVLLVDDDRDNLHILALLLTDQGANVHAVASASQAFQVLESDRPDVLVSDLAMPEEDGYSLIEKVRAIETQTGRHLPSIALTAYVRVEDRTRALSRGFDMFVPKPVEPSELITAISNLSEDALLEPTTETMNHAASD